MKHFHYILTAVAVLLTAGLAACDDNDEIVQETVPMAVQSTTPEPNATIDPTSVTDLTITYNHPVKVVSPSGITLNGASVETKTNVLALTIPVTLAEATQYTLQIAEGAVARYDHPEITIPAFTLTFSTIELQKTDKALSNPNANEAAKALYAKILASYGQKTLSGCMGAVNWGTDYYDLVTQAAGASPAIIGFDYIHLQESGDGSWINYGDITPVKDAVAAGAIPAISFHWQVSASKGQKTPLNEQEQDMGSWSGYIQMQASSFADAQVGNQILVTVKDLRENAQGSFKNGSWSAIAEGYDYFTITGDFTLDITDDILTALQSGGLVIGGQNYTATAVYLVTEPEGEMGFKNQFSPAKAVEEGTWENGIINADLKKLAGYLKLLQDENIAVLWRPFHEAAGDYSWGNWFWWGNDGVEATKTLWKYTYDKLTNEYGLNNLVWVWTMQTTDAGALASVDKLKSAYPGHDYVDIVGTDIYPEADLTSQKDQFDLVNSAVEQRKMVAMCEVGKLPDFLADFTAGATWAYFMQWYECDDDGNFLFKDYSPADVWAKVAAMSCIQNR